MEDKSIVIKKINHSISQLKKLSNKESDAKKVTKIIDEAKDAICSYSMQLTSHLKDTQLKQNPSSTSKTYMYGNDIYNNLINNEMTNRIDVTNIAISDLSIQDLGNPKAEKAVAKIKKMIPGTYVQDKAGNFNFNYLNPKVAIKILKASINNIKSFNLQDAITIRKKLATIKSSDDDATGHINTNAPTRNKIPSDNIQNASDNTENDEDFEDDSDEDDSDDDL